MVLVESHAIPKFTGILYFRSGNAVTALETPGLAEITAAVVRTGTAKRTSRQIEEDLRRMGADLGTSAGSDTSAISFSGLAEFSSELLALVSELAQQASFPVEEFERERRQMIEGLRIERTTPSFLASERLRTVLFGKHPYGLHLAHARRRSKRTGTSSLPDFYSAQYRPGNALLVVVGDFSPPAMLGEIERIFGSWAPAEVPQPPNPRAAGVARPARSFRASAGERADAGCCSAITPSRASIPIGCASAWPIRSTAERSIRGW